MDLVTASVKLATVGVAALVSREIAQILGRDFRKGMENIGSGSADGSAGGSLSDGLSKGLSKGLAEGISGLGPGLQAGISGLGPGLQAGISGLSPGLQEGLAQGLKYAGEAISPGIQGAGANFGRSWFDFVLNTQLQRKKAETEAKLEAKRLEEALASTSPDTASTIEREAMERRLQAIRNLQKRYGF